MKLSRDKNLIPTKNFLSEAVRAGLVLDIIHFTDGVVRTDRSIVPLVIGSYKTKKDGTFYYLRGYQLRGGSASGASMGDFRLFKLDNMRSIKWVGNFYSGTPSGYTPNDSFFKTIAVSFNNRNAKNYRSRNDY
jgi:hypothetical protein